ncbi:BPTI/Kunitz domain-containing protein [Croceitalea rosinachiae]|uniref:BPTI/Kunitz domain-containing protein n=1 Tax=Croceitalea rosinachiae TaxID=3075596 RepID=A0ABU3ACZ5_9FLAO|nr:BPTI/Kunitz domain-containing protein [Croceitalea sp. F388]MDT0606781.1 BPTI/Kunitz domain-containing protein [Croceitalea sp. F388]
MKEYLIFALTILTLSSCSNDDELSQDDLDVQLLEIRALSEGEVCNDVADWRFVAIGAKACGGPSGYMAYSIKIDTLSFFAKVEEYTSAQKQYNMDNGIISDCAIDPIPVGIQCKDDVAVLIYSRCELLPDSGPCFAAFTKYYFDKEEQACKEFIWGGCEGVVPFDTLEECKVCEDGS